MPIVGILDEISGSKIPLSEIRQHHTQMPLGVVNSMVIKAVEDRRHQGPKVTVTAPQGCPRKWGIERMLDVFVDASRIWARQRGTWLHEQMAYAMSTVVDEHGEQVYHIEETEEGRKHCEATGKLFGVDDIGGLADALKRDYTQLVDYKFRKPGAVYFINKDGSSSDSDAAQMNTLRILMEQRDKREYPSMEMLVWVDAGGWHKTTAPYLTEDEIGQVIPGSGKNTILKNFMTLIRLRDWWMNRCAELGVTPSEIPREEARNYIKSMEMTGVDMFKSRKGDCMCSAHCELMGECYEIEGGL